jgi:predicted SAM-dependent methyltransferase
VSRTLKQRAGRWLFGHLPITRFLFDQLRFEANAWIVRTQNAVLPGRRARLREIRAMRHALVNVACGPQILDGFVNVELVGPPPRVRWDCRTSVPIADEGAAGIRVEHFLEHIEPREHLPAFLRDCRRALEPGGVLRIIVPDAERYLQAYCQPGLDALREMAVPIPFPDDLPTRMDVINHVFHSWHEHRWAYDLETLSHRLRAAGFTEISRVGFGRSALPALAQDRPHHAPYSLYVEAVKSR